VLDPQQSVAAVVLDHSECAQVFQRHRIDFCCKGEVSLEAAASARQLDVEALVGELTRTIAERRDAKQEDPRTLATPRLVALIVSRYHDALRRTLPFVRGLAVKVSRVHGDHNPALRELEVVVEELVQALLPHLDDEEQTLFPLLVGKAPDAASVGPHLAAMQTEHLAVGALLERARAAADDFELPAWACTSYRTLFAELEQLEADVFEHVHLENHVLRPRFELKRP
jgi:regulator of cell morphogenesis and NO signaling